MQRQCLLDDHQSPHMPVGERPSLLAGEGGLLPALSPAGAGRVRGILPDAKTRLRLTQALPLTRPRSSGTLSRQGRGLSSHAHIGFETGKCTAPNDGAARLPPPRSAQRISELGAVGEKMFRLGQRKSLTHNRPRIINATRLPCLLTIADCSETCNNSPRRQSSGRASPCSHPFLCLFLVRKVRPQFSM